MNNGGKILVRYVKGWVFFGLLKTVFTFSQGQWWSCFYRPLGAQWAFEFPIFHFYRPLVTQLVPKCISMANMPIAEISQITVFFLSPL